MVEKWQKNIKSAKKVLLNINFDNILNDIKNRKFEKYRVKKLNWYADRFRIRIWQYRIIFSDVKWEEIKIIAFDKRWDIYKKYN